MYEYNYNLSNLKFPAKMKRLYVATSCSCRLAEEQLFSEDSMVDLSRSSSDTKQKKTRHQLQNSAYRLIVANQINTLLFSVYVPADHALLGNLDNKKIHVDQFICMMDVDGWAEEFWLDLPRPFTTASI